MSPGAICVYCASSPGINPTFQKAAASLGHALARTKRTLVYGGGSLGLMGTVSQTVIDNGGEVYGVLPYAMAASGGEGYKTEIPSGNVLVQGEAGQGTKNGEEEAKRMTTVIVSSMHERKTEMARKADGGFVALPGGFGTFEEVLEATTWSQIKIHTKPVVVLNVLGFFDPLRQLIKNGIDNGFIRPQNISLITFVDGPEDHAQHAEFDWGSAALQAVDEWTGDFWAGYGFDWTKKVGGTAAEALEAT